jgi:SPP1 gp7 family putative phage head morphogenesis protein
MPTDTTNELLADETRTHAIRIDRYSARTQASIVRRLREMLGEIREQMASADWESLTDFRQKSFRSKLTVVQSTIKEYYDDLKDETRSKLIDLNDLEVKFIERLSNEIPVKLDLNTLTPTELKTIATKNFFNGTPLDEFWDRQSTSLRNKLGDQIRLGIMQGDTNKEIVERVIGNPKKGLPGIADIAERDARTIVRTSVQTVANSARIETFRNNRELIRGVQWVSTLDGRTSQQCMARDGLVWLFDADGNLEPDGHSIPFSEPPIHHSCRSTLIPITKSWKELGFDRGEVTAAARASMDGEVAPSTTMDDWLKNKPAAFVDKMLGATKGAAFRNGDIKLRDLLDQWGNLRTSKDFE